MLQGVFRDPDIEKGREGEDAANNGNDQREGLRLAPLISQRCTPCFQGVCKTIFRQRELSNLKGNQHELVSPLGRHSPTHVPYHTA
jgi:hypothetical protein